MITSSATTSGFPAAAASPPGKLNTATCKSYTYRLQHQDLGIFPLPGLAGADPRQQGSHQRPDRRRLHQEAAHLRDRRALFDFDATETEPPNTNSFFGPGGYSIWAADITAQKVRGCITISSGLGSDISKCLDMTFQ